MINKILPVALLGAVLLGAASCQNGSSSMKKLKGIEYSIVKDAPGKNAQIGDIIEFHFTAKCDTMKLADSREQNGGKPITTDVKEITNSGQFEAVFPMLSAGDSAIVEISCDTLIKNMPPQQQQLPPWMKKGSKVKLTVSMISVKSKADYEKEAKEKAAKVSADDEKSLQDYFTKKGLKPTKTASGLYYIITKEGAGPAMEKGQNVTMNYKGMLLDGTTFDTNMDSSFHHKEPFTFPVGVGRVIPGWDEGVMLLKKGSKASFFIPSPMAYGAQAPSPQIPPNSILVFDVEVTDIKAAPAQPQAQAQPQMTK